MKEIFIGALGGGIMIGAEMFLFLTRVEMEAICLMLKN